MSSLRGATTHIQRCGWSGAQGRVYIKARRGQHVVTVVTLCLEIIPAGHRVLTISLQCVVCTEAPHVHVRNIDGRVLRVTFPSPGTIARTGRLRS